MACFIINWIKKEELLYIIMGKNQPVCFFLQRCETYFVFKNMSQNSCFVCQGLKLEKLDEWEGSNLCCDGMF